jgi:hypothetical protein
MAGRGNLQELPLIQDLDAKELRLEIERVKMRYKVAVSRYEFFYASELKEDLIRLKIELRRRILESEDEK